MQPASGGEPVPAEELVRRVERAAGVEGMTLSGGEPFEQPAGLCAVAEAARRRGLSVLVFSGYPLEELRGRSDPAVERLLRLADVLIDGPYQPSRASRRRAGIGSDNQRVHHLTDRYVQHPWFRSANVQSVSVSIGRGELRVSGWPELADRLRPR